MEDRESKGWDGNSRGHWKGSRGKEETRSWQIGRRGKRRQEEIQPSGEESNVKERVSCITIQDAFHCIAVAH